MNRKRGKERRKCKKSRTSSTQACQVCELLSLSCSKKNKEQRENVISELVQTEREFCRDLKLTWQAFALDTPEMLEQRAIDVTVLFGNLGDVIELSETFLDTLQVQKCGF